MAKILVSGAVLFLMVLVAYPSQAGLSTHSITRQRLNFLLLHSASLCNLTLDKSCYHRTSVDLSHRELNENVNVSLLDFI